jgi:hypothetical protein
MPSRSCLPEPTVALGGDRRNGADRLSVYFTGLSVALALVPHAFRTGTLAVSAPHGSQSLNIAAAVSYRPAMLLPDHTGNNSPPPWFDA